MNELEKAYQEIEGWHCYSEQEGFVNEEEISYLNYIKKHINDLQSKIDKAVETINYYASEDDDCGKIYNDEEKELLDILKESKELNNTFEIPEFKGTMEQLDELCDIRKEDK